MRPRPKSKLADIPTVLFMDDELHRWRNFQLWCPRARWHSTAAEMIEAIGQVRSAPVALFLDHDLNGERYVDSARSDCGMEVVRHLERIAPTQWAQSIHWIGCHSLNEQARREMTRRLCLAGYPAYSIPFSHMCRTIGHHLSPEPRHETLQRPPRPAAR